MVIREALLVALAALLVCALAEALHARRTARVAVLAFGPAGRPRPWARAAPFARVLAATAAAFGLAVLLRLAPNNEVVTVDPEDEPSQHLLLCLDVSPSMYLRDAGPRRDQSRSERAADVLEAVMARIDMRKTRVTVVAFYTSAKPVVVDAFDLTVVRNVLRGLPLEHAFETGQTKLQEGVEAAMRFAKPWAERSAALVVVSDGDTIAEGAIDERPSSIADALVIGVGDPHRGTQIAGRTSRQDAKSLKQLAARLDGIYHDGNERHLPSDVVASLGMTVPTPDDPSRLRDFALAGVGLGALQLALLPLLLRRFGAPRGGAGAATRSGFSAQQGARAPAAADDVPGRAHPGAAHGHVPRTAPRREVLS